MGLSVSSLEGQTSFFSLRHPTFMPISSTRSRNVLLLIGFLALQSTRDEPVAIFSVRAEDRGLPTPALIAALYVACASSYAEQEVSEREGFKFEYKIISINNI